MSKSMNLDALTSATTQTEPWHFAYHCDTVYDIDKLIESLPEIGFEPYLQKGYVIDDGNRIPTEWYNNEKKRALVKLDAKEPHDPDNLPQPWIDFTEDLLSDEYRDALSDLVKIDTHPLRMRAYFHVWGGKFGEYSCQPHVDVDYERLTHIFLVDAPEGSGSYWMTPTGVVKERHLGFEIKPTPNQTIIQVRSEEAWHAISGAPGVPRHMVHIVFETDR